MTPDRSFAPEVTSALTTRDGLTREQTQSEETREGQDLFQLCHSELRPSRGLEPVTSDADCARAVRLPQDRR